MNKRKSKGKMKKKSERNQKEIKKKSKRNQKEIKNEIKNEMTRHAANAGAPGQDDDCAGDVSGAAEHERQRLMKTYTKTRGKR
jgi:hypothetical protein